MRNTFRLRQFIVRETVVNLAKNVSNYFANMWEIAWANMLTTTKKLQTIRKLDITIWIALQKKTLLKLLGRKLFTIVRRKRRAYRWHCFRHCYLFNIHGSITRLQSFLTHSTHTHFVLHFFYFNHKVENSTLNRQFIRSIKVFFSCCCCKNIIRLNVIFHGKHKSCKFFGVCGFCWNVKKC